MLISTKEVPIDLVRALGIRKRKCLLYLRKGTDPTIDLVGTEWGGGSRSYYTVVDLLARKMWNLGGGQHLLAPGHCVVETGYFQGKTATPTILVRDDDLDLWLGLQGVPRGMPGPILMDWLLEKDRMDEAGRVRALLEGCHILRTV